MRSISIVVNTLNRADSLRRTLESFSGLDHDRVEVVVVNGPSTDHTAEILADYEGRIKVGDCPVANISMSRNIGIQLAAGEVVAFIDDDAYPDPGWLDALDSAYDDLEIAAAGGPTFDHTGHSIQAWTCFIDRLGNPSVVDDASAMGTAAALCGPESGVCPLTMGTNSSFRRDVLVALGGFDEEFEYYHDEADVCRRIVDAGYVVRSLDDGFVYHKFLPSHIRPAPDLGPFHFQVLKSKFYFGLKHGKEHLPFLVLCRDFATLADRRRLEAQLLVAAGAFTASGLAQFEEDLARASTVAVQAAERGHRQRPPAWFGAGTPFVPFATRRPPGGKLHVCLVSQEYPPGAVHGIGRVTHLLATGLAAAGHVVRVLTCGRDYHRVDLEEGVWVHRLIVGTHEPPQCPPVPAEAWNFSATVAEELARIDGRRRIDVVQAPNWDSQAVAAIIDGRFQVVTSLHTPVLTVARVDPAVARWLEGDDPTVRQLAATEEYVYDHADGLLANTSSVVEEIESAYPVTLDRDKLVFVPHGLPDMAHGVVPERTEGKTKILFIGRLEPRKGIDVLLAAAPGLVDAHPEVLLTVVGDFSGPHADGMTYPERFAAEHPELRDAVQFLGSLPDDRLWRHYAGADVLVAPSRYESFGLIVLEAMIFSTPVVASDIGGMREVVVPGETGLLVPPGDAEALGAALGELAGSAALRRSMGAKGRARYEETFAVGPMVERTEAFYRRLLVRRASR